MLVDMTGNGYKQKQRFPCWLMTEGQEPGCGFVFFKIMQHASICQYLDISFYAYIMLKNYPNWGLSLTTGYTTVDYV